MLKRTTKTKSKKGHNSAKIWQMITNIELDLYFIVMTPMTTLTVRTENMIPMCLPCYTGDTRKNVADPVEVEPQPPDHQFDRERMTIENTS